MPTVGVPRYRSDADVICTSAFSQLDPLENGEVRTGSWSTKLIYQNKGIYITHPYTWDGDLSSRVRASDYIESLHNVTCRVRSNPVEVYNFYFLSPAKGAVRGVFAYYPHPGGQGLSEPCIFHCIL